MPHGNRELIACNPATHRARASGRDKSPRCTGRCAVPSLASGFQRRLASWPACPAAHWAQTGETMDRRQFLSVATGLVAGSLAARAFAQVSTSATGKPAGDPVEGTLTIDFAGSGPLIPDNFNGLSVRAGAAHGPEFFRRHQQATHRTLPPALVRWRPASRRQQQRDLLAESRRRPPSRPKPPKVDTPADQHWMPAQLFQIVPRSRRQSRRLHEGHRLAIDLRPEFRPQLAGAARARSRNTSPAKSARACCISRSATSPISTAPPTTGPARRTGDSRTTSRNGWRARRRFSQKVPDAKFGGPDVGSSSNWITQFIPAARKKLGQTARRRQRPLLCRRAARRSAGDHRTAAPHQPADRPQHEVHRRPGGEERPRLPHDRGQFVLPRRQAGHERRFRLRAVGRRLHAHAGRQRLRRA